MTETPVPDLEKKQWGGGGKRKKELKKLAGGGGERRKNQWEMKKLTGTKIPFCLNFMFDLFIIIFNSLFCFLNRVFLAKL